MMKTEIDRLSREEIKFMLELLTDHRNYYRALAGNAHCSPRNWQMFELVESLCRKLGNQALNDLGKQ
jgi:hypothetical protein